MNNRQSRRPIALIAVGILGLTGCMASDSDEANHHDDHIGHVIPAHKPKDFPAAVRRLREWNDQITARLRAGKSRSLIEDRTLAMTLDVANWLPEIAADSDMPEAPWNQVNDLAPTLTSAYGKLAAEATGGARVVDGSAITKTTDAAIRSLETILKTADPRWFAGGGLHPESRS